MQKDGEGLSDTQELAALREDLGLKVPPLVRMEFIRHTETTE